MVQRGRAQLLLAAPDATLDGAGHCDFHVFSLGFECSQTNAWQLNAVVQQQGTGLH